MQPEPDGALQDDSLLLSIAAHPHLLSSLLLALPAADIARLLAVCPSLRADAATLLPMTMRLRGVTPGSLLRVLSRAEAALLHEDFSSGFSSRWERGPSAPPPSRAAYRLLEVAPGPSRGGGASSSAPGREVPLGSSAVSFSLPLAPGCRALHAPSSQQQGERAEVLLLAKAAAGSLHAAWRGVAQWWVQPTGDFRGAAFRASASDLVLTFHPSWQRGAAWRPRSHSGIATTPHASVGTHRGRATSCASAAAGT